MRNVLLLGHPTPTLYRGRLFSYLLDPSLDVIIPVEEEHGKYCLQKGWTGVTKKAASSVLITDSYFGVKFYSCHGRDFFYECITPF